MLIPNSILIFFSIVGIIASTGILYKTIENIIHYLKFKSFPMSKEEETIIFLKAKIKEQNIKVERLEKETEKMTMALLNHLS